jgi:hypothetical protein
MHKLDPRLGPVEQDERSVIPIDATDIDHWLGDTVQDAQALLQLAPLEIFDAGPSPPGSAPQVVASAWSQPPFAHLWARHIACSSPHGVPACYVEWWQGLAVFAPWPHQPGLLNLPDALVGRPQLGARPHFPIDRQVRNAWLN